MIQSELRILCGLHGLFRFLSRLALFLDGFLLHKPFWCVGETKREDLTHSQEMKSSFICWFIFEAKQQSRLSFPKRPF